MAEYRNLQEQTKREVQAAKDFALQRFAKDLLDSVDNLDRALENVPKEKLNREQNPELVTLHDGLKMTDEILIRQEAEKRGITVSKEEIDNYFKETFGFFPNGTATPTITPTEFVFPTISSEQMTIYPSTSTPTEAPTGTAAPTGTPDRSVTPTATATQAPPTPTFVPEQATASPTPYTLEGYQKDYDEMLKHEGLEAVCVATATTVHAEQTIKAIEAGKHVLCEKPLSTKLDIVSSFTYTRITNPN